MYRSAPTFARAVLLASALGLAAGATPARSEALLLVDTDSGRVLHAENATHPWYPASITKIMTTYVTLRAVKEGRITLDSLVTVSAHARAQQPSKMGFPVGTRMTVDHALKMMMVKSANDVAVVLAEGVSGSVPAFAEEMNRASRRLGMTQSHWVNPNGLPDSHQVTSARDMAILARAINREFPQYSIYWRAPAIRYGKRVMRNYNRLIDRYPGADGMKTGFICASGYNLVATATRGSRRLTAIVLGASSGKQRNETAARLLERGFNGAVLSWLAPSFGSVDGLQPVSAAPPNLREEICGGGRGRVRTDHAEEENHPGADPDRMAVRFNPITAFASALTGPGAAAAAREQGSLLGPPVETMAPLVVTAIPPKGAPADPEALLQGPRKKRGIAVKKGKGRKTAVISAAEPAPKAGAKPAAKPNAAANGKPAPKASAKPAAKPAPKPAPKAKSAAAASSAKR